jgi:hypothetical protein
MKIGDGEARREGWLMKSTKGEVVESYKPFSKAKHLVF